MKSIQTFLEEFNCIHFEEKPQILLEAWFKFFAIKRAQPENSNELFQKLLEDLKELAEYKESLENSSKEIDVSNSNQEKEDPPQDSDIHQLIKECSTKDLIESALNFKLLLINSNSQRLDKKEQEVKNVLEQPAERATRVEKSLQNFRVIHKSSTSLNNTSQISPVHAVAPILSTEEPEHSLSMSKCEVTSEDESECDVPAKDDSSPAFTTFSNLLFNDNDDITSSDDESLLDKDVLEDEFKVYSNPLFDEYEINSDKLDSHCFNVESDFVKSLLNRDTFIGSSFKFDFSGKVAHINPEIKEADFDFEEEIRLIENLLEEIDIVTETDDVLPPSVENDDDSSNDPLLEEADLFLSDNSIPSGIENSADDPEGDIRFLEELLIDDSILSHESSDSNFEDNPSFSRPPPEPPNAKFDFKPDAEEEIPIVMNKKDEFDISNDESDDYFPFMFVIRIFLPYLICSKMFLFLLSAESEDTIFDPGFAPQ
nr:hypothetical protein [Tanacetum cinerariifolium]